MSTRRRMSIRLAPLLLAAAWGLPAAGASAQGAPPAPAAAPPAAAAAETPTSLDAQVREWAEPIRVLLFLSALVFLPAMLLTLTSYTRIIIVLAFVRRAIGTQDLPPNPILVGLALFLTIGVMSPTFGRIWDEAVEPYLDEEHPIPLETALHRAGGEMRSFLLRHTREDDLALALDVSGMERPRTPEETPLRATIPAFVLSELRTAFRMGFVVFLPFVLIDLVVAAVLLSLGMFMLPPTMIAMPLKILLFILVDGWSLIVRSLLQSFPPT